MHGSRFNTGRIIVRIDRTWDGRPIPEPDVALVEIDFGSEAAEVAVASPYHGDPPPEAPVGPADGLWNHEVVEVFLCGSSGYLEVELGPHGHYLVLELGAPRVVRRKLIPIEFGVSRRDEHGWQGTAVIPRELLPAGLDRFNAYRAHGSGPSRRYLAAFPVPGERPDFHRLEAFGPLDLA